MLLFSSAYLLCFLVGAVAYSLSANQQRKQNQQECLKITNSRRDFCLSSAATIFAASTSGGLPSQAFDGSGSSAYAGKSPATKAALKKGYQDRIVADVRDFNALGAAIDNEQLVGKAWVFFFATTSRREPDSVGRTYAALTDFVGLKENGKSYSGGDGLLLANTFTKAGKPPDNTPAVKKYNALAKSFDPIADAGSKNDLTKAKKAWDKASILFSDYLAEVELPSSLSDPLYQ